MNEVKLCKEKCLADPDTHLWTEKTVDLPEIKDIYRSINKLEYKDKPDYQFIRNLLLQISLKTDPISHRTDLM